MKQYTKCKFDEATHIEYQAVDKNRNLIFTVCMMIKYYKENRLQMTDEALTFLAKEVQYKNSSLVFGFDWTVSSQFVKLE